MLGEEEEGEEKRRREGRVDGWVEKYGRSRPVLLGVRSATDVL